MLMFMTERMKGITELVRSPAAVLTLLLFSALARGDTFRVATYNLESYFDIPTPSRAAKSVESKAKIRESILALKPDVLALQELGSVSALLELRDSLKSEGLELPHWQFLSGTDTNIHIGLLSKFPFAACRSHTNESYLLTGRRFHVSRGFAEVDINVTRSYSFTLIAAHLKSKRTLAEADESEMRLEEAKLLREKIDARLSADPDANLVVLGDFNDTKDSASTRAVIGRGKTKLVDTRPAERNGDDSALTGPPSERRCITWTHYYGKEDSYRRIDFLLLSKGMAREWIPQETYVLSIPRWGLASDHRPLVAAFEAEDR
jgi:endonuclease/exonuclease/phosphatase family metal-dependent hydrolase